MNSMASLPPPTIITPFSSTFPSQSQLPARYNLNSTNFLINGKCKNIVLHRVSHNDSNTGQNTTTLIRATSHPRNLDRRNLLRLGLIGSLYGASMNIGSDDPLALASANSFVTQDTSKPIFANAAELLMPPMTTSSSTNFPTILDKVVRVRVKRSPETSRHKKEQEGAAEEVLLVDGIEFERNEYVKFDVLVNEEDESACGPDKAEFVGSFSNVPHKGKKNGKKTRTCLRLGIGELLEDLGAEEDESLLVSLVPRAGIGLVTIGGVNIELDHS